MADNLGWTDYEGGFEGTTNTIEDYFRGKGGGGGDDGGEGATVHRVNRDVFDLERVLGHDTSSGSIVDDEGNLALE